MPSYLYTFACHEDEAALCELELRSLFQLEPEQGYLVSELELDPKRSPFIRRRMSIWFEEDSLADLRARAAEIELGGDTFKVVYTSTSDKPTYDEQRQIERELGGSIHGTAEMRSPSQLFGVTRMNDRWLFGPCMNSEAVWLAHQNKPQNYSTALGTRVARAIVNIAVSGELALPIDKLRVLDPCCGMGTVLIEALSMGIQITGVDRNPLAVRGARVNLSHYGYSKDIVSLGDMQELTGSWDAAIVDMPYNLCSVLPIDEQLDMLRSVRRLAGRAVIVTTVPIEQQLEQALFRITDRCQLHKGSFTRYITVAQ